MARSQVTINQQGGRSGRPLPGFDHYTGLIIYGAAPNVAGKWKQYPGPPVIKAQQMFSESDATKAGIIPFSDNVAASGSIVVTRGATGDKFGVKVTIPLPLGLTEVIDLGTYEQQAGDATLAALGAAIAAKINTGTVNHGFVASFVTATLTIVAPKKYGVSLNTGTPLTITVSGAMGGVVTQFQNGTASDQAIWFYHISEYFRIFPKGNLWVGIIADTDAFNEVKTLQKAASSKIRQIGFYDTVANRGSAANITGTISQVQAACKLIQGTAPLSAFYSPNIKAVADLSTYPDQNINTANKVQTILSQDGAGEGALLYIVSGKSIGNIGAKLATIAKSRVSASDAQAIDDFNVSDGVENDVAAFGNGVLLGDMDENLQDQLDSYNYVFFRKWGDEVVGTYWTSNKCCISSSSDYANVNDNRTSDKVSRICYSTYVPLLNAETYFNKDGTLQNYTVASFESAGKNAVTASMITSYGATPLISGVSVSIDPTQPVKQTSTLVIDVEINQNGIARNIVVNIAYGSVLSA